MTPTRSSNLDETGLFHSCEVRYLCIWGLEPRLRLVQLLLLLLLTKTSGKFFRVGIFLDLASSSARTPHGLYVQMSGRNRIDPRWGGIERLTTHTLTLTPRRSRLRA